MRSTKEGRRSLLAAVLIGVAAVNTGNNLIYLVLSLMLSFLLLAYLLPRLNLLKLSADIGFDGPLHAGAAAPARITLVNAGRLIPAYSVHVSSPVLREPVALQYLAGRSHAEKRASAVFGKRGLYSTVSLTLESSFPFILFYAVRRVEVVKDVIVYPAYVDIDLKGDTLLAAEGSEQTRPARTGEEMAYLRSFREGDDPRQISWKASAKGSGLMVREYALQESSRKTLVLINSRPDAPGDFEKAVSVTASLARDYISGGDPVRVVAGSTVVPFGSGYEHLLQILDVLALVREDAREHGSVLPDEDGCFVFILKSAEASGRGALPAGGRLVHADIL